jgi:hypothetical protein
MELPFAEGLSEKLYQLLSFDVPSFDDLFNGHPDFLAAARSESFEVCSKDGEMERKK